MHRGARLTAAELAALDRAAFLQAFADVFEHSAWIAEGAWAAAPFSSFEHLHAAMVAVLDAAGREAALTLVRAHPDLAGKAALAGDVTPDSRAEQTASGLSRLTAEELASFTALNAAYKSKFSFPFVMAVRKSDKAAILAAFEERLPHSADEELSRAIIEIKKIARLRLEAIASS
jgi:OHCU decarboxylase